MKYFLDTEFSERPGTIDLISVGIVAEDGREFYAENRDFSPADANVWVRENVLTQLVHGDASIPLECIGQRVREFIGTDTPEFWGYYADYDWVVFCWLFGAMVDLPKGWPMYCRDLKQWSDQIGAPKFNAPKGEHNALADARWNKAMYSHLASAAAARGGEPR